MKGFRLFFENELDWGYFGNMKAYLGGNESSHLNYGTAPNFGGSAMLYVPLHRQESGLAEIIVSARRAVAKQGIQCVPDSAAFAGWRCGLSSMGHKADLMHTGESHVTVARGDELSLGKDPVSALQTIRLNTGEPLFEGQKGLPMPVTPSKPGKVVYGVAKSFKGKPLVALLKVECPRATEVRDALKLPRLPGGYVFHITIGYAFGKWTDDLVTTNPKGQGIGTGSARQKHNSTYQYPEWFTYLGELYLD